VKDENKNEVVGGGMASGVVAETKTTVGPSTQDTGASAADIDQDTTVIVMEALLNWKPLPKVQKGLLEMVLKQEGSVKASLWRKSESYVVPKSSIVSTLRIMEAFIWSSTS